MKHISLFLLIGALLSVQQLKGQIQLHKSLLISDSISTQPRLSLLKDNPPLPLFTVPAGNNFQLSFINGVFISSTAFSDNYYQQLFLPAYSQGLFCDFEDQINKRRKLRIDFSVK